MPHFASYDGLELGYRVVGNGPPLVCFPGGPGRSADYLGDLGGLDRIRQLVLLDPRGVGRSDDPIDPATRRVDRLVEDLDALRAHLGLDAMDLLAHSAGCLAAILYAARFPERISRLVLVTPGLAAVGVYGSSDHVLAIAQRSVAEPWYPDALAAMDKLMAGDLSMDVFRGSRPLFYARWDAAAQAHASAGTAGRHMAAREGYFAGLALDVPAIQAGLRQLTAPVLLYAGELDPMVSPAMVREAASHFSHAAVSVQPGARHFPWVDDPTAFATTVGAYFQTRT